jgi:transposase-like protein
VIQGPVTYLQFTEAHYQRIRTTNRLERLNGESRRWTNVIPRVPTERSCLSLLSASFITASKHWRGIPMTMSHVQQLPQLRAANAAPTKEEAVA